MTVLEQLHRKALRIRITSVVIGLAGYAVIAHFASWKVALGVFLVHWSHNLEKHSRLL